MIFNFVSTITNLKTEVSLLSDNFRYMEDQSEGWKAEYKELSKRIRQHKMWRKPKHRPSDMSACGNISTLESLQEQARIMCAMRVQAKAEAGRRMVDERKAA